MAFGLELGGEYGKLALSVFRIIAVGLIGYYMLTLVNTKVSKSFLACIALIFAGAVGNIIDSAFYGLIFPKAAITTTPVIATLLYLCLLVAVTKAFTRFGGGNATFSSIERYVSVLPVPFYGGSV